MGFLATNDVGNEAGIEKFIEKNLNRREVRRISAKTPQDLIPRCGRTIEQTFGGHGQPLIAIAKRYKRGYLLPAFKVPHQRAAVFTA